MTTITETFALNNGLEMPKVGFGTWQTKPGQETYEAVSRALTAGYRFIDTAKAYRNEASVGEAIRDSDVAREDLFIQTKLPAESKTYDETLADFESSLAALDLDYVDSYIIHAPWPWAQMGSNMMLKIVRFGVRCRRFIRAVELKQLGCLTLIPMISTIC